MKRKDIEEKIKEKLPRVRDIKVYVDLVDHLYRLNAFDKKHAVKTRDLNKIKKSPGGYLKKLSDAKILGIVKKGSARFMLNPVAPISRRFLHTSNEIKVARQENVQNLLNQIQENPSLLLAVSISLGLKSSTLEDIMKAIEYSDDLSTARKQLENYNLAVLAIKKTGISLKDYDELHWMRGSYSWYIKDI